MKFVVSAIVVVLAVAFTHADLTAEQMEKLTAAMEVCKPKTGATDDDLGVLMQQQIPDTKTGQCFIACMYKEFGAMSADNKIDMARITELSAPLKERDAAKYETVMKITGACAEKANVETDACVVAKIKMECCIKGAADAGLTFSDFLAK